MEAQGLLDQDLCYRALTGRDARFDGRFFVCVKTTGIYCRPVCPARTPKRANCVFVPSSAAAETLGYRSCLRCRPETAPGTAAWAGTEASVARALRLIDEGALDEGSVELLAARLGIGARQLHRLFVQHLGASPLAVAGNRRLLVAKQLITETELPFSEMASAAGFQSLRRFNDAVRTVYRRNPSELRRGSTANGERAAAAISLRLGYRPPSTGAESSPTWQGERSRASRRWRRTLSPHLPARRAAPAPSKSLTSRSVTRCQSGSMGRARCP